MDGSFGELLYYIFKWSILIIAIIGIIRIRITRKDSKRHRTTKFITFLAICFTLYLFIGEYIENRVIMKELSGIEVEGEKIFLTCLGIFFIK